MINLQICGRETQKRQGASTAKIDMNLTLTPVGKSSEQ